MRDLLEAALVPTWPAVMDSDLAVELNSHLRRADAICRASGVPTRAKIAG